jgi:hypothetical protein
VGEKHQEQTDGFTSANPRPDWVRPEVCRFDAGAAEAGDVRNPDGNINS